MVARIPLTRGEFALVDDADAEFLLRFKWRLGGNNRGHRYAIRSGDTSALEPRTVMMHRVIADAPSGTHVDHFDNDGLNNQRRNLRILTPAENLARSTTIFNKHGHRGIAYVGRHYYGRVSVHGYVWHTKGCLTPEEASAEREVLLLKRYGSLAILGVPQSPTDFMMMAVNRDPLPSVSP